MNAAALKIIEGVREHQDTSPAGRILAEKMVASVIFLVNKLSHEIKENSNPGEVRLVFDLRSKAQLQAAQPAASPPPAKAEYADPVTGPRKGSFEVRNPPNGKPAAPKFDYKDALPDVEATWTH